MRDSQRNKVYTAERVLMDTYGRRNLTISECQQYADKVLASAFVRRHFGTVTVNIEHGRGGGFAYRNVSWFDTYYEVWRYGNRITLGKWARREIVVLHELAHVLAPAWHTAAHGWEFCATYLNLVRHFLGAEAHDVLKDSFKANRVKFTKPREKRVLPQSERQSMADRMMAVRAAKMAKVEV